MPTSQVSLDSSVERSAERAGAALVVLVAAGALAGALGEAALILGARIALDRYTLFNPQGVWLAPLANAILLAVPMAIIWIASRWRSGAWVLGAGAFVAAFAATLEPLLVLRERLHIIATLALCAGVATQMARWAMRHPGAFLRHVRLLTAGLAIVAGIAGAGFNVQRAWRESRAAAALGDAAPEAPNVLLLVLDTVRALSLSAYGHARPTSPFLAELAAQGVQFDRAIAPSPWTLPSHATMFTGRYPHELSAGWSTPLDETFPTLAERLGEAGYFSAGVAANLRYVSYEFGLSRGFTRFRDYDVSIDEMWRTSELTNRLVAFLQRRQGSLIGPGRQDAARISARLLEQLEHRGDRPFFAFANFYDAHAPYAAVPPYDTLFLNRRPTRIDPAGVHPTPQEVSELLAAYEASIRMLDDQLRRFFDALRSRGLLDNTIVVVTSDHGEEFDEHGHMDHGHTLYAPSLHVPLIVVAPERVPAGRVVTSPVTLRDLPATILHLTGAPAALALPGRTLAESWGNPAPAAAATDEPGASPILAEVDFARNLPESFAISRGDMRSAVLDGMHLIRRGDGHEELYDLVRDPWERHDRLTDTTLARTLTRLRATVDAIPLRTQSSAVNGGRP